MTVHVLSRRRAPAEWTIVLGYLPPSLNRTMYRHWSQVRRSKQQLQRDLEITMLAARVPRPLPGGFVDATAVLVVPTRHKRDTGNFQAPLEKALGDALVRGGWLPDDTPDSFRFGGLTFEHRRGISETRVRMRAAI